jgi:hypothetical protein
MSQTIAVPPIPNSIKEAISRSQNVWVKQADQSIKGINDLAKLLPEKYGWRFRTVDAFKSELAQVKQEKKGDCLAINQFYWRDLLGYAEAFELMTTWRTIDMARSCVWAVAKNDVTGAALFARAGIENVSQFIDAARTISATIAGKGQEPGGLLAPTLDPRKTLLTSSELEKYLLKTVFGSRLPDTAEYLQSFNVLGIIKRLSKTPGQETILQTYELLCEVAHPNFFGKSIYLLQREDGPVPGNELCTIGPGNGPVSRQIIEASLSALSWTCAGNVSAFELLSGTVRALMDRLHK